MLNNLSKAGVFALGIGLMLGGVTLAAVLLYLLEYFHIDSIFANIGVGIVSFALCLFGYFMPTIIASKLGHPSLTVIALINIFSGWSVIGWFISMFWAVQVLGAKRCNQCKEVIRKGALVCKHCQASVAEA